MKSLAFERDILFEKYAEEVCAIEIKTTDRVNCECVIFEEDHEMDILCDHNKFWDFQDYGLITAEEEKDWMKECDGAITLIDRNIYALFGFKFYATAANPFPQIDNNQAPITQSRNKTQGRSHERTNISTSLEECNEFKDNEFCGLSYSYSLL